MGPILDLRAGLNIEMTPDATFAWLPDRDSGCVVRCTSAIHVSSDHRGMGSVASHLRGSSVHSFVYSKIYMGVVGERLPTHTTPLHLLYQRFRFFAPPQLFLACAFRPLPLLPVLAPRPD